MRKYSKDLNDKVIGTRNDKNRCLTVHKKLRRESSGGPEEVCVGKYKYYTELLLGEGYSSKVYQGIQIDKPHKRFAIKVINLSNFEGENFQMLQKEIQIHSSLNHENIVNCYDVIKTQRVYYLVLEHCPHGSLQDLIRKKRKLGLTISCEIMDQILEGYNYLASCNIIHRDIKPSNILKSNGVWKIADFGFAVKKNKPFVSPINVGTPLYMPLESLIKSQYSFKSDIFALGVTLYQMIHGQTPWDSRTEDSLIKQMKEQPLVFHQNIKNETVLRFIRSACTKNPEERMDLQQLKLMKLSECVSKSSKTQNSDSFPKVVFKRIEPNQKTQNSFPRKNNFLSKEAILTDKIKESFGCTTNHGFLHSIRTCKQLYSLVQNIDCLSMRQGKKQIFWMTIFKFLLRLSKQVEKQLEAASNQRSELMELKQLQQRYEKEYLEFLKLVSVAVIRGVNKQFPELSNKKPFDRQFYRKMNGFLAETLNQVETQDQKVKGRKEVEMLCLIRKVQQFCVNDNCKENMRQNSIKSPLNRRLIEFNGLELRA